MNHICFFLFILLLNYRLLNYKLLNNNDSIILIHLFYLYNPIIYIIYVILMLKIILNIARILHLNIIAINVDYFDRQKKYCHHI